MHQPYNPKNKDVMVNVNGQLSHRDEAGVSPFDSSVQNGDAVWEGLRLYKGRIFKLKEHLERLRKSAALLQYEGFPEDDYIVDELRRTLETNQMEDGVHMRLMVSRGLKYTSGLDPRINTKGCTLIIMAEHKAPVYGKTGLRFITAQHRRPFANVLNQHIHSSNQLTSILAKLEANQAGVDDALMLDTDGNLAETNATHVFLVKEGQVLTSTTDACPEGITRSTVLKLCQEHDVPCQVRHIPESEIHLADEMFCTGTMGEIAFVAQLDDTIFNGGVAGEMTEELSALYEGLIQQEADPAIV